MMQSRPRFPFDPPLYPERIAANVPLGFKDCAKRAAARDGVPLGEFVRRALRNAIDASGPTQQKAA